MLRNELPVEPHPPSAPGRPPRAASSDQGTLGPRRAIVIKPPLADTVSTLVLSF